MTKKNKTFEAIFASFVLGNSDTTLNPTIFICDLGPRRRGLCDRLFWHILRNWPCVDGGLGMGFT